MPEITPQWNESLKETKSEGWPSIAQLDPVLRDSTKIDSFVEAPSCRKFKAFHPWP